jgi:hypothetical protein
VRLSRTIGAVDEEHICAIRIILKKIDGKLKPVDW